MTKAKNGEVEKRKVGWLQDEGRKSLSHQDPCAYSRDVDGSRKLAGGTALGRQVTTAAVAIMLNAQRGRPEAARANKNSNNSDSQRQAREEARNWRRGDRLAVDRHSGRCRRATRL
ncbi:hypothetical protein T310_5170 [Rasamsonia emersonii CBS 393.64]|uniref:Uncharacterized protein n=1 Tax=Rasamsonia emersonii (strain ATCC 16479 / CBS 393.64 / IMI 116815) TaxID=1408163 RepID=A0A0F4YR95_RASE3|nr:hypothetical protein T310_5170 [Rasamsonia emersonii CBS 393.64]KKA20807.1 hypothetical protein T310_5170 [Rasamsonia emersonii CBS 393.64]